MPRVGWIFAGFLVVGAFLMLTENRTQRVRYSLLAPAAGLHVHALVHASRPRDFAKLPKAKELSGNATILPILEMLVVVVPQAAFAGWGGIRTRGDVTVAPVFEGDADFPTAATRGRYLGGSHRRPQPWPAP